MDNKKICSNCNTVNRIEAKFCVECGNTSFVLPNQKPKYCYSCLIGFTGNVCPICEEENYTKDLMELIKKTNRFTNKFDIDKSKELEQELEYLIDSINDKKSDLSSLNDKHEFLVKKYNKLKNEYDNKFKELNNEINKLELELESKKNTYKTLDEKTTEIVRKVGVQSISNQAKESKMSSLEKEYNEMVQTKNDLINNYKALEISLEKIKNEYKTKPISNDVLEFSSAIYGSLGDYYLYKDGGKAVKYYEQSVKLKNEKAITNLVLLINEEYESYYNEQKAIELTNYAYNIFYKNDQRSTNDRVAISTIFSNPKSKYFNKEKALKFIPSTNINNIDDRYFIGRVYERLGMKEEALKNFEVTYSDLKNKYSDSDFKKYSLRLLESAIKRLKK